MGWLGRVLAKTQAPDLLLESYPLVFPNETTEQLAERWEREVLPRLASNGVENRMIIAVPQDPITMAGSSARARLHLANTLDRAAQHNIATFVVGPTPAQDRSEEHTSELQSRGHLVCRLLLEKKKQRHKRKESKIQNQKHVK